jgi:hypothetical protein
MMSFMRRDLERALWCLAVLATTTVSAEAVAGKRSPIDYSPTVREKTGKKHNPSNRKLKRQIRDREVTVAILQEKDTKWLGAALGQVKIKAGILANRGEAAILVSESDKDRVIAILRKDMKRHRYEARIVP